MSNGVPDRANLPVSAGQGTVSFWQLAGLQALKDHFEASNRLLTWGNVRSSHLSLTSVDGAWLVVCPRVKRAAPTVLCDGLPGIVGAGLAFVLPAGVGLDDG